MMHNTRKNIHVGFVIGRLRYVLIRSNLSVNYLNSTFVSDLLIKFRAKILTFCYKYLSFRLKVVILSPIL